MSVICRGADNATPLVKVCRVTNFCRAQAVRSGRRGSIAISVQEVSPTKCGLPDTKILNMELVDTRIRALSVWEFGVERRQFAYT